MESVDVLGVNVACVDVDDILGAVQAWGARPELRTILYVNAHCLNVACGDGYYREILSCADLVYSDGISVVWAGRLLGGCSLQKITGADWIFSFSESAERAGMSCYILAGKPGVAGKARENLLRRYPGLEITGASDGFFIDKSEAEVLKEIEEARPHVVFVGMGTPRQEKWLFERRAQIQAPVCWAVGALFDYVAGIEPRVPGWMNALALEWLWRLMIDPRGKWRRYVIGNPVFLYRVFRQYLRKAGR